jgi:lipoprotein NlpD
MRGENFSRIVITAFFMAVGFFSVVIGLPNCAAKHGFYHRVEKGETLYRISNAYQVPIAEVGRANNLRDYGGIREGQYILIPDDGERDSSNDHKISKSTKKNQRQSRTHRVTPLAQRLEIPKRLKASNLRGRFIWPVLQEKWQKISQGYGVFFKQRHTGVDIPLANGTDIAAVDSGTVISAGNKVAGFGNTIIIRHREELFSVYSYMGSFNIKAGDLVERGQFIGKSGSPNEVHFSQQQPLLHFEIRERTIPINPENLLP